MRFLLNESSCQSCLLIQLYSCLCIQVFTNRMCEGEGRMDVVCVCVKEREYVCVHDVHACVCVCVYFVSVYTLS